ncbi:hypothetical protein C8C99_2471 [Acidovorax sp. 107]|uniref:hypothetical protein n=1 Tax=Acidovorax sp. 107 TaxID=2135638 RepID=UPI000D396FE6|nr:hypothetical protein [Acidovorax sp. 107]PUA97613.1 hypothetical protein C8C99_2471 [Acidovorax sp. 107]
MASQPPSGYRWGLRAVIALQCLLIFAFVYQGLSAPGPFGPRLPAVQGDTLWLESHGALHQFDANGRRLQQIPLSELKISDGPTSLQFTQAQVFWVHDDSRVHRCDLQQRQCLPVELAGLDSRRSYRWVRVSDDESEIIVSDASHHRVLVYRRDAVTARYTLARTETEGLRFPNQTLQVGPSMWVANTNRHEILQLHTGPDGKAARQPHTITYPDLRPGRSFPFAMAQDPRGQLWVLVAGPNMQNADLLIMNPQLRPERVIPLAPKQDPNAITLFQQHMLLTDMSNFLVRRLDLYGRVLGPFGDASFQAELEAARNQAQWSRRLPTLLMSSIGVLLLVALWLAWKAGELRQLRGTAWRADPAATAAEDEDDDTAPTGPSAAPTVTATTTAPALERGQVTMVKALPGSTRTRRRMLLVTDAVVLLAIGALVYWAWPQFYQHDCAPGKACAPWMPYAFATLALLPLIPSIAVRRRLKALESIRIGTDGEQVQARVGKKHYQAPADQVTCTRQQLLIGLGTVPLRLNGQALFDEEALRHNIINRLPQMHMADSPWHPGWLVHYWKRGGWRGRAIVIGMGALCGLWLGLMLR